MKKALLMGLLALVATGCDESDDKLDRLLAGCGSDKDCPEGLQCKKRKCVRATAEKPKEAKKAPTPKPDNVDDLVVRLCPGYWGKSHNTGTVIAKHITTGKKRYLSLPRVVPDGDFQDEFAFANIPHGVYEVVLFTGVIAQGKQDLLHAPCGEKMPCKSDRKTRILEHKAPLAKEAREAQLLQWRKDKLPGTEGCPKGYECDTEVLRRPCDFDIDRELPGRP